MPELDLEAIKARADAATEGPWHGEHGEFGCVQQGNYGWVAPGPGPEYDVDSEQGKADAEFIAHARTDIPLLLAEFAEAERHIERGNDETMKAYSRVRTLKAERYDALRMVLALTGTGSCRFGIHGECQAHGWLADGGCPKVRAESILEGVGGDVPVESAPAAEPDTERCAHCGDTIDLIDGKWKHRPGLRSPHDPEPWPTSPHPAATATVSHNRKETSQ